MSKKTQKEKLFSINIFTPLLNPQAELTSCFPYKPNQVFEILIYFLFRQGVGENSQFKLVYPRYQCKNKIFILFHHLFKFSVNTHFKPRPK